jgi:peptidoglycan/xylan/chitin deacetylase (PgdA/CDA1 family)
MYFVKTPDIVKPLYPSLVWDVNVTEKIAYLTFDDGPTPGVTDKVLNILDQFNAKATFFLIGKNAEQNPDYLPAYTQAGHAIGNHSYSHMNGWLSDTESYLSDIEKAAKLIESNLMRPPYGRIKRAQLKELKDMYSIVMWDILSGDFDPNVSPDACFQNVIDSFAPGSIIVFHDSIKASKTLLESLPRILRTLSSEGYRFEALQQELNPPMSS